MINNENRSTVTVFSEAERKYKRFREWIRAQQRKSFNRDCVWPTRKALKGLNIQNRSSGTVFTQPESHQKNCRGSKHTKWFKRNCVHSTEKSPKSFQFRTEYGLNIKLHFRTWNVVFIILQIGWFCYFIREMKIYVNEIWVNLCNQDTIEDHSFWTLVLHYRSKNTVHW